MNNPGTARTVGAAGLVVGALLFATGCSAKYGAERDGKKAGEAICDVRDADSPEEAQQALDKADKQLDDLGNKYAMYTAEDRRDLNNNLADLAEHRAQGQPNLMYQDLTVIERSID